MQPNRHPLTLVYRGLGTDPNNLFDPQNWTPQRRPMPGDTMVFPGPDNGGLDTPLGSLDLSAVSAALDKVLDGKIKTRRRGGLRYHGESD